MTEEVDILKQGKTAIIYARVSTKGQADTGVPIDTQLKVCREWCERNGVKIVATYHDDGVSGTTTDRPAFESMMGSVIAKHPHYLVVYDSSRLTRGGNERLDQLKSVLEMFRCEVIYAGYGGLSGSSDAATYMDAYKSTADSLFVSEQKKKTRESINKNIAEGRHVSRSVAFAFEEDIPLMPRGRILERPREHEKKDSEGRIYMTTTPATVVKSEKDFFALVDRGASIEVIAEMWGISRYSLLDAVRGINRCEKESCNLPSRYDEYKRRFKVAKDNGISDDVLFEQYRRGIRERRARERKRRREKKEISGVE